jgi:nicotinate phosphoribosyltransferase
MPSTGTMAHAFIQMFGEDHEQDAFAQWLLDYPGRATLLVDTYNTRRGVERAIAASIQTGVSIKALRIDSGDLIADCIWARKRLDDAGMTAVMLMPTGDLDEFRLDELLSADAPFDASAAGTKVANAAHFGGVYKITEQEVELERRFVMKKAVGKVSDPGRHQVWRRAGGDVISLADELISGATAMLHRVMAVGGRLQAPRDLAEIRDHARASVQALPEDVRALADAAVWPVERSQRLMDLRVQLGDATQIDAAAQLAA